MPTGYTAAIADGISFDTYAMNCARAFGACIEMRDDPADKPIPEEFKPETYHLVQLTAAQEKLRGLKAMRSQAAEQKALADYKKALKDRAASLAKIKELRQKYEAMLEKAQAYTPPSPEHQNFKDFMVSQITDSIKWDCSTSYYNTAPVKQTGAEWLAAALEDCRRDVTYHTKGWAEEQQRAAGRTLWVKQLRESLTGKGK